MRSAHRSIAAVHSNKYLYEKQYFKCQKFKGNNKAKFDAWLAWRATGHKGAPPEAPIAITAQLAAPAAAGAPAEAKEEKKGGKARKADDSDDEVPAHILHFCGHASHPLISDHRPRSRRQRRSAVPRSRRCTVTYRSLLQYTRYTNNNAQHSAKR